MAEQLCFRLRFTSMKWSLTSLLVVVILLRMMAFIGFHMWSMSAGKGGFSPLVVGAGDDGEYYYATALAIADDNGPADVVNIYPVLLGKLMRLTGITEIFWLKLLNAIAGCGALIVGIRLYNVLARDHNASPRAKAKGASVLILLLGLYPSAICNCSASLYRDAWLFLLHLACVYTTLQYVRCREPSSRIRYVVLSAILVCALCAFRWYAALSVLLGVLAWFSLGLKSRMRNVNSVLFTTATVVVLIAVIFLGSRTLGLMERWDTLTHYRTGSTIAGSSLGIDLWQAPPHLVLPLYAYSFVSNLLGPLPWQINSISTLSGFLTEGPLLMIISYGLWKRRRYLDMNGKYVLCQALVWLALISFSNDNLGTALRLRVIGWHCLFVLYAYLLYKSDCQNSKTADSSPQRPELCLRAENCR